MKNEVAAVVGVGPGLGAALVKRFANEGFTTIAVARRASSWTSLRGGDGPVILYDCDATVPSKWNYFSRRFNRTAGREWGRPPR